jgi:uncharacterized protein (DUF2336 family)
MSNGHLKRLKPEGDAARRLLAASRERFSVAAVDLLLPPESRLSEWQRITASALLACLVRSIEDELRASLADRFSADEAVHAALGSTRVEIAIPVLERAQALKDADIGTALVRRVEEHRFWKENGRSADAMLGQFISDEDAEVAAEAMGLLIARGRRFDRFQEPLLGHTDLPADLHHRLVWNIAAALRHYLVGQHKLAPGAADAAIAAAADEVIASYDEGRTLDAVCLRLCRRLHASGRLDGGSLAKMLEEGQMPLFLAGLAVRSALDAGAVWEILSDPEGNGPALLLRAAALDRKAAASILYLLNARGRFFSDEEGDAAAEQLQVFDATPVDEAVGVIRLWQADPGYRAAVARLSTRSRSLAGPA